MGIRTIGGIAKRLHRQSISLLRTFFRRNRLSTLGLLAALSLFSAWFVGAGALDGGNPSGHPTSSPQAETSILELENKAGAENSMITEDTGNSSINTQSSVTSDASGTTVTINGDTTYTPPGQSVERSYISAGENNRTQVDISIQNSQASQSEQVEEDTSTSRSRIYVHTESSTDEGNMRRGGLADTHRSE